MHPEECKWKELKGARCVPRTVSMEGTPGGSTCTPDSVNGRDSRGLDVHPGQCQWKGLQGARRSPQTVSMEGTPGGRRAPRRMQMRLKSVRCGEKTPIILKIIYTGHKNKFVERIL